MNPDAPPAPDHPHSRAFGAVRARWRRAAATGLLVASCVWLSGCPSVEGESNTGGGPSPSPDTGAAVDAGPQPTGPCGLLKAAPPVVLPAGEPAEAINDKAYLDKARQLIRSAADRLDIVQFETDNSVMVELLAEDVIEAYKRGVTVRVLFDELISANETMRKRLDGACVPAKLDSGALRTHAKLIYTEQAFLVGSTNWSDESIGKNHETNLLVRHKGALTSMGLYIDALWKNSSQPAAVKVSSNPEAAVYGDGGYKDLLIPMLEGAKQRIWLTTYTLSVDPGQPDGEVNQLVARLDKAVKRGVDVRVLLDLSGDWAKTNNEVNAQGRKVLESLGIAVRQEDPQVQTHAKFIVIDDSVVVGTNNWSYGGLEKYHETGVRTNVKSAVEALAAYHEGIWKSGK